MPTPEHTENTKRFKQPSEQYQQRFGGIARLYGKNTLPALNAAHFAVCGLGGVGSWVAEALARTGIGKLTLIDLDDVCVTNTNRQVHALQSSIGQSKLDVMAARLRDINPEIELNLVEDLLFGENIKEYLGPQHDVVIDAIDTVHVKAGLVAYCKARKMRLILIGSSGGKRDPLQVCVSDLGNTTSDPMLVKIRQLLYRKYNFSRDSRRRFGIDTVYSTEQMVYPKPDGEVCQQKSAMDGSVKLDCADGFGSVSMLTGNFAFVAASKAVERYLEKSLGMRFLKKH